MLHYDLNELRSLGLAIQVTMGHRGGVALTRTHERVYAGLSTTGNRTPYIGHEVELATPETPLEAARTGRPRYAGLAGEPGIGKSRHPRSCTAYGSWTSASYERRPA